MDFCWGRPDLGVSIAFLFCHKLWDFVLPPAKKGPLPPDKTCFGVRRKNCSTTSPSTKKVRWARSVLKWPSSNFGPFFSLGKGFPSMRPKLPLEAPEVSLNIAPSFPEACLKFHRQLLYLGETYFLIFFWMARLRLGSQSTRAPENLSPYVSAPFL